MSGCYAGGNWRCGGEWPGGESVREIRVVDRGLAPLVVGDKERSVVSGGVIVPRGKGNDSVWL
jgi:hypothetical protein